MAVDLHLHSTASDGTESPARIAELAIEAGLRAIALTDHDNLEGIAEAREAAGSDLEVVSGTELSVDWEGHAIHLLVYFLEPGPGPLQNRLGWLQESRHNRNVRMVERCNELGIDITFDEVFEEALGRGVGRPHFAAVMLRKGHVRSITEAFDRFLGSGGLVYEPRERLAADEAIELAIASGAVTSLAHPHTVGAGRDEYASTFRGLAELGLHGIETYYAEYEPAKREHLTRIADDLGLVATGGSDFHGSYKPGLAVGTGRGDLEVGDDVLEALRARASGT